MTHRIRRLSLGLPGIGLPGIALTLALALPAAPAFADGGSWIRRNVERAGVPRDHGTRHGHAHRGLGRRHHAHRAHGHRHNRHCHHARRGLDRRDSRHARLRGWYCRPCGLRFHAWSRFERHAHHHHRVAPRRLVRLLLPTPFGWIYIGS